MWNYLNFKKKFPPDPHGFCSNFVRWMDPSRNKNPENLITLSCAVQKLWPPEVWTLWPGYQTIKISVILKLFYSATCNKKHLKFGLVNHFHEIIPKTMYLAKKILRDFCGGELKLSKLLLRCFSFHFQRAVSWKDKI